MTTLKHVNAEDVQTGDELLLAGRFEEVEAGAVKTRHRTLHGMAVVEIRLEGLGAIQRPALWPMTVQR